MVAMKLCQAAEQYPYMNRYSNLYPFDEVGDSYKTNVLQTTNKHEINIASLNRGGQKYDTFREKKIWDAIPCALLMITYFL